MKFAAIIDYTRDKGIIEGGHAAHREYLRRLLKSGRLAAAGPLSDDRGALWVFDAEDPDHAEEIVKADPFFGAGAFAKWQIFALAYWSAKACKGEK